MLQPPPLNALLNLNKPPGISSAQAVNKIKHLLPAKTKIGHAGTLDPFATGVLIILIGHATKLSDHLMAQSKEYAATLKLGATTPTLDPESEEIPDLNAHPLPLLAFESLLPQFTGTIQQIPPQYSALKVGGQRAYKLARQGQTVELPPRPVQIYDLKITTYNYPALHLHIHCGKGVYIRSLALDLARAANTTAYLTALSRTRSGQFKIENATPLADLTRDNLLTHLISPTP